MCERRQETRQEFMAGFVLINARATSTQGEHPSLVRRSVNRKRVNPRKQNFTISRGLAQDKLDNSP